MYSAPVVKPSGKSASSSFACGSASDVAGRDPVAANHPVTAVGFQSFHQCGPRHFSFSGRTAVGSRRRGTHRGATVIQRGHRGNWRRVGAAMVSNLIKIDGPQNLLCAIADAGIGAGNGLPIQPVRPVAPLRVSHKEQLFAVAGE